jgi:hypothetical protein
VHGLAIRCADWYDVARGYADGRFGPLDGVKRGQMASFIARTIRATGQQLPASPPDRFTDDTGHTHELAINQLAAVGIVLGRADGQFRPDDAVSRAQMTSFLVRAYQHVTGVDLPLGSGYFSDVDTLVQRDDINRAAAVGLTGGSSGDRFAGLDPTLRGQMSTFLARLLDLFVEDGVARTPGS